MLKRVVLPALSAVWKNRVKAVILVGIAVGVLFVCWVTRPAGNVYLSWRVLDTGNTRYPVYCGTDVRSLNTAARFNYWTGADEVIVLGRSRLRVFLDDFDSNFEEVWIPVFSVSPDGRHRLSQAVIRSGRVPKWVDLEEWPLRVRKVRDSAVHSMRWRDRDERLPCF